ncbi:MAG TPA: BatA domain-containing protein [Polyangia bacterium]|jgi:hypothetical protein|nr:BatA domain-containing protein [Polyangia bacterium]
MGFLVPGFAALVVLAGVPIVIHLLGRPRAERRPFAAMAFLLRAERETAARRRLQEILLLVARALVIAAIPLLLAKPYLELRSNLPAGLGGTESAVIVLDDTRSMSYRQEGTRWFDRARVEARRILTGMGHGSEVALLLVSRGAAPLQQELTTDRVRVAQMVAKTEVTHAAGDLGAALKRAAAILAGGHHRVRRVYLVSDLAAHGVGDDLAGLWGAPGDKESPSLVPVDVTGGGERPNRAVVGVHTEAAPELGPRGVRLVAEIANFSPQPLAGVPVTLMIDGKAVAKGLVDVPAQGRVQKRFAHSFGPAAGEGEAAPAAPAAGAALPVTHEGSIELGPDPADGLGDDDRRFFRIDERRTLRVLLVDGDPRTIHREDEVYYLETALHAGESDDVQFDVSVVTADELRAQVLAWADVAFLANVKAPDGERATALRAFVERGGGLFIGLGSNVDPDAWNAILGELLPQPLATLRTVGPTRDRREDGEVVTGGTGERIDRFDRGHPVLEPFALRAGGADEALREARVGRFALLQPTPRGAAERRVLLHLDSGAPLLVEGHLGNGRVLLLTTTLDRDWSDLAIQPGYLPLVQQAARYLGGALVGEPETPTLVGAPHPVPLPEGTSRVEIELPSGKVDLFGADRVAGRKALEFARTSEPGLYHVSLGISGQMVKRQPDAAFAVNVDPIESDLTPAPPAKLAALSRPQAPESKDEAAPPKRRIELWHAIGLALLALLLIEGTLALPRRR